MKNLCLSLTGFKQVVYFAKHNMKAEKTQTIADVNFSLKKTTLPDVRRKSEFYA